MRVLVTGASGFVGGATIRGLRARGDAVVALTAREEACASWRAEGVEVVRGSTGDPNVVARAAEGCDAVVHAAGAPSDRGTLQAMGEAHVAGTTNVLRGARHAGCRRVVHVSCADVTLAREPRKAWNEDRALREPPREPYARTKLEAEEIVIGECKPELETVVLRPAWVWGPGDWRALPGLCREGLDGGIRLVGRGDNLLATTYIDHLAAAIASALTAKAAVGAIYYLIDGELTLASGFFGAISDACGLPPPRRGPGLRAALVRAFIDGKLGRPSLRAADVLRRGISTDFDQRRARADLGYDPRTSHEEGMKALGAWVAAQGGARVLAERFRA